MASTFPPPQLDIDEGLILEGIGFDSWRYPSFTIEMETGTGKTYAYTCAQSMSCVNITASSSSSSLFPASPSTKGLLRTSKSLSPISVLYGNETVNLIRYDGSRLSQLRSFASSSFVEVLVITLDSFNKSSNVILQTFRKAPRRTLPYQFIQETRPILILDEPQNMESAKAKEALRTLNPLFALRYSATHRTSPNLVYRLSPFDAFRLNLVKKIQVCGVTERENFNQPFLPCKKSPVENRIQARCSNLYQRTRFSRRNRNHLKSR